MSVVSFTIYTLLSCFLLGIDSIEGYHGVSLTGLPAYVTRGQVILPRCIFRTDNFSPPNNTRRISLSANGRRVKEVSESVIRWRYDSGGEIKVTEFSHMYTVDQDTTFKCTVEWGAADVGTLKEAVFTVPVGCPLRCESQSTIMDTATGEYGVNIVVSGEHVGQKATTIPPPHLNRHNKSPMVLEVTPRVMSGVFHLGQKEATLFSVRWRLNPDWDGLCEEEKAQEDRDYTLQVSNAYDPGTTLSVKFTVQYPAIWVKTAGSMFLITDSNKHNLTLHCSVCALPQASFTWTLCGDEVPPEDVVISQSGAALTIREVGAGHVGTYQCIATNVIDKKPLRRTFGIRVAFNENFSDSTCRNGDKVGLYTSSCILIIIVVIGIALAVWKRKEVKGVFINLCATVRRGCCPNTRCKRNRVDDSHRTGIPLKVGTKVRFRDSVQE